MEFTARLPADLAAELQAEGLARPIPQVRSSGSLIADLIIGLDAAAAIVTIVGMPIGDESISQRIFQWLRRRTAETGTEVHLSARTAAGHVEFHLNSGTSETDVAAIVTSVVETIRDDG